MQVRFLPGAPIRQAQGEHSGGVQERLNCQVSKTLVRHWRNASSNLAPTAQCLNYTPSPKAKRPFWTITPGFSPLWTSTNIYPPKTRPSFWFPHFTNPKLPSNFAKTNSPGSPSAGFPTPFPGPRRYRLVPPCPVLKKAGFIPSIPLLYFRF